MNEGDHGDGTWLRKLLDVWPDEIGFQLRQNPSFNIYSAFMELKWMLDIAIKKNDVAQIDQIMAYANWCANQKARALRNAAGVSFFEDIVTCDRAAWPMLFARIDPQVICDVYSLLEWRLSKAPPDQMVEVERLTRAAREGRKFSRYDPRNWPQRAIRGTDDFPDD
ncbi:DUF7674 family protein [Roseiterribacter gracilis]|uniref:DUF7674 domain-containing protein n=1 Tax=Roseiterribacter gracilis TaxID=2812848 RepID=A0A8S8XA50_9PROT|nr:hypothetical protein TMPK1_04540 [Rhodospirillales bacterium TMPK1]